MKEETTGQLPVQSAPVLGPDAVQILLQVAHLAADTLATPAHLRQALELPAQVAGTATMLRPAPALRRILRRARQLAEGEGSAVISCRHLQRALDESEAQAAGLDLRRLEFARWLVQHWYGAPARTLSQRQCGRAKAVVAPVDPDLPATGAPRQPVIRPDQAQPSRQA